VRVPRVSFLPAALFLCAVASAPAVADDDSSNALDLVEPARTQALGGAAAGIDGDPTAIWMNPAASANSGRSLTFGGQRGFIDDETWQASGVAPVGPLAAALGVAYYDSGVITLRNADGTSRRVTGQRDLLVLANAGISAGEALSAGASVKLLRSDLLDEFHATAVAADAGVVVRPGGGIAAGLSIQNAGRRVRYRGEGVPLPIALRAGVAAGTPVEGEGGISPDRLTGFLDAVWLIRESRVEWRGGVEADWGGTLFARAGVSPSRGDESWRAALGVGVVFGKLRLDYAIQLSGPSALPQVVSLTVKV
jgi:hypothetical protein